MYCGDERAIKIPGFSIAAREWGDKDGLPVIALHGWLDNASSFEFLAPLLKDTHVIAIDGPGCGHSSPRSEGAMPSILDEIFYVLQVANAVGFNDFVLLAHSRGGALAQLIASACPERVKGLVLLDIVGFFTSTGENASERLRKGVKAFFEPHRSASEFKTLKEAAEGRMLSSPIAYESALALAKRGTAEVNGTWIWNFDRRERNLNPLFRFSDEQLKEILEGVTAPTSIILAEEGIVKDREFAKERASHFVNHELHYIPGGHHVHMDDAASVAAVINPFLDKLSKP